MTRHKCCFSSGGRNQILLSALFEDGIVANQRGGDHRVSTCARCGKRGCFSPLGSKPGLMMQLRSVTTGLAWPCQEGPCLDTRTSGQIDRCGGTVDKGPSSRQWGFFHGLWLQSSKPGPSIPKSQNVGLEPLPRERGNLALGRCPWQAS